jgi:hypothetical protein
MAVLAAAGVGTACRDAASDPLALVLGAETHGALALGTELPRLPDLAVRAGVSGGMREALDLWTVSWEEEPVRGRELRTEAYRQASPELAEVLGTEEARRVAAELRLALDAVAVLDADALGPAMLAEVSRARDLHARAARSLDTGDVAGAFGRTLEASDALRAIAPPTVARMLLSRAAAALEKRGDSLPVAERERAERLVDGAEKAIARAEWARAIQRAFYACQLLGLSGR